MPRPGTALTHRRLGANLKAAGWFADTVTVEWTGMDAERSTTGMPQIVWRSMPLHEHLPARIAAASISSGQHGRTVHANGGDWLDHTHTVALVGYYPMIDESMRVVTADDATWTIVLAVADSEAQVTMLHTRAIDELGERS